MKSSITTIKIGDLLDLRKNGMLKVNAEYQRGEVWNITQQKKLIDSVLRGYPLPMIYLHHKKKVVANMSREDFEIIDGQQRLLALEQFKEGGINLFHPIEDDKVARFPKFVKEQPCPWAGQNYDGLSPEFQEQFSSTEISVAQIETDSDDEARDLFIRLQAGLPLNAQEKRDAWPGGYTEFVLKLGGKPNNIKYPGHNFFKELVAKTAIDRGQIRQLSAQIGMLFLEKAANNNWCEIKSSALDDYYYRHLDFNNSSPEVIRFRSVIDKIYSLLGNRGIKKLKGHEAIHLILLVDTLMNDYTPSWEGKLLSAFEDFRKESIVAKRNKEGEYWTEYVQWIMTSSDTKPALMRRHNFFSQKMYTLIKPQLLDSTRGYGSVERQIIYYRDNKICAVCKSEIVWDDLEIHHVDEHQHGGLTTLENGVPVHKKCHPKGNGAIEFAKTYYAQKEVV